MTDEIKRKNWDAELLKILETLDYRVFGVIIDKNKYLKQYGKYSNIFNLYEYGLYLLFERVAFYLKKNESKALVNIESSSKKLENKLFKKLLDIKKILNNFSVNIEDYLHLENIIFYSKSANINGIQVCDLLASGLRNRALFYRPKTEFQSRIHSILNSHVEFRNQDDIRYGIKYMPTEIYKEIRGKMKQEIKERIEKIKLRILPSGYKKTPVGICPSDWEIDNLGKLGKFSKGAGIPGYSLKENGIPCVLYGDLYTKYNIKFDKAKSYTDIEIARQGKEIEKGSLLFTASGETAEEIGKCVCYIGNENIYAGGDIIVFNTNKEDSSLCQIRFLDPKSKKGPRKPYFSIEAVNKFIELYNKQRKPFYMFYCPQLSPITQI